jgi:hypothetical protein
VIDHPIQKFGSYADFPFGMASAMPFIANPGQSLSRLIRITSG